MLSQLKYQWHFSKNWNKHPLNFLWNQKRPQITKELLKRKNKAGGITTPDFEVYYKAVITKHGTGTKTDIDQWNRTENPEMDPRLFGQLIFDKAGKSIWWKKDSLFNKWCWENWTATCKRMKPLSHTIHKNKLQMDERPQCETGIHHNPTGEHRQQPL